ncbi:hypothetical protein [Rhizobium halophilum]|uniref:hypothetical protein n=1 Tax=Rhizobium halophilum TaxID=2846852 RepID=UPI00293F4A1B|nr:hypothetical protein [Rhizobium halophilum]
MIALLLAIAAVSIPAAIAIAVPSAAIPVAVPSAVAISATVAVAAAAVAVAPAVAISASTTIAVPVAIPSAVATFAIAAPASVTPAVCTGVILGAVRCGACVIAGRRGPRHRAVCCLLGPDWRSLAHGRNKRRGGRHRRYGRRINSTSHRHALTVIHRRTLPRPNIRLLSSCE